MENNVEFDDLTQDQKDTYTDYISKTCILHDRNLFQ